MLIVATTIAVVMSNSKEARAAYFWPASPEMRAASLKRLLAAIEEAAGSAPS